MESDAVVGVSLPPGQGVHLLVGSRVLSLYVPTGQFTQVGVPVLLLTSWPLSQKTEKSIKIRAKHSLVIKDYRAQQGITFVRPSLSYLIKIISNDLYNNIVLYTMKPIQMIPFSLYLQIIPVDLRADISWPSSLADQYNWPSFLRD